MCKISSRSLRGFLLPRCVKLRAPVYSGTFSFLCLRSLCCNRAYTVIMFLPCSSRLLFILSSVCPVANIFLLLRKNTERISMKFVRGNCYHEHIKWLYFWRNWNRNKETGYERKFESTSIGFAAMSNRCRRLANETNSQISQRRLRQMRLRDTISRQFKDFTYVSGGHFQKDSAPTHRATVRSFSWCDTSTQH